MGNPVVMNCAKIVMKCSSLSMILYLTRIWAKRRLRFFAAFPGECVNGKQGKCSRACDFCSAKMLVGIAPQTRRKPPDTVSGGGDSRGVALAAPTGHRATHLGRLLQQIGERAAWST